MDSERACEAIARAHRGRATQQGRALALGAAAPRAGVRWSFDELAVQFPAAEIADGCPQPVQVRAAAKGPALSARAFPTLG
jgi:hypothetical protein